MKNKIGVQIGVVGLWHLGTVYSACLAEMGFVVSAYDNHKKTIENLRKNKPPIFEPGLDELITKNNEKTLFFVDEILLAVKDKKYIFLTLDVPVNNRDRVQMASFWVLVESIVKHCSPGSILVISSQVPVGTCRKIQDLLNMNKKNSVVVYMPENLRLGSAIGNFLKPDRIVLGAFGDAATKQMKKDFEVFDCEFISMSPESAEMSKHAMNAYLALNISFSSEIGDLCELVDANLGDVVRALKTDQRVSPKAPLSPGLGFAGGTLGRDLETIKSVSRSHGYKATLAEAIIKVNKRRIDHLLGKILTHIGSKKNAQVGILGLTYKPGTNTLRRSQSLDLITDLTKKHVKVRAYDKAVDLQDLPANVKLYDDPEHFFSGLDAVVLMTQWPEFLDLITPELIQRMRRPTVIDSKNFLDKEKIISYGASFVGIGYKS